MEFEHFREPNLSAHISLARLLTSFLYPTHDFQMVDKRHQTVQLSITPPLLLQPEMLAIQRPPAKLGDSLDMIPISEPKP